MTDSELAEEISPPSEPPGRRSRGGTGVAWLALIVATATAAFVGYRAWQAWATPPPAAAPAADLAALEARVDADVAALTAAIEAQANDTAQQAAALQVLQTQQTQMATTASAATPMLPTAAWQLAEAEYLLRLANHRALLEADAAGAEQMLAAADELLAAVDPFAYHEVRALLATERTALQAVAGTDVQGIFLRLDALKAQLQALPLRLPAYIAQEEATPPPAAGMLSALGQRLAGLVRFRSDGPPVRPLLPPQQAEYLQQHLRLALNHAQLAALRGDQTIFARSLGTAAKWLDAYVDMRTEAAQTFAGSLDALLTEDLGASLPDISGSLARLRAMRSATTEPAE